MQVKTEENDAIFILHEPTTTKMKNPVIIGPALLFFGST